MRTLICCLSLIIKLRIWRSSDTDVQNCFTSGCNLVPLPLLTILKPFNTQCLIRYAIQDERNSTEETRQISISWGIASVQFSRSVVFDSLRPHEMQHARPPCPSPTTWVYSNSCPLSRWCHPTISSSTVPFSCLQSFTASGSSQMSQLLATGGQSIGVSVSISVLPVKIQDWFPSEWTGWISLQRSLQIAKGLSRVFSNTTVQKHQFFGTQLSS